MVSRTFIWLFQGALHTSRESRGIAKSNMGPWSHITAAVEFSISVTMSESKVYFLPLGNGLLMQHVVFNPRRMQSWTWWPPALQRRNTKAQASNDLMRNLNVPHRLCVCPLTAFLNFFSHCLFPRKVCWLGNRHPSSALAGTSMGLSTACHSGKADPGSNF